MANFLQTLIPLALLLAVTTILPLPARAQDDDSTSFTYDFYGEQPTDLTYQGDAHFPDPSVSTYLRLTNTDSSGLPTANRAGRILHTAPIKFWESGAQADFETTLKFIMNPVEGKNPGDGLAFFIAPVGSTPGATGQWFGIFDSSTSKKSNVFAVEFDVYINGGVDPPTRHVGIDIENLKSSNVTEVGDALLGQEVTVRIDYKEASNLIRVQGTAGSTSFDVSYVFDLSKILDQQVQVGISASTGTAVAVYDVISWYFTSTLVHTGDNKDDKGYIRQFV